jgi:hypothetical protein
MTRAAAIQATTARNLLLAHELNRILAAFREQGIEAVVLKGIPFTRMTYPSLGSRAMNDNDVLVRRHDVVRADAALRALGYQDGRFPGLEADLSYTYQHTYSLRGHSTVVLDLHWDAFDPRLRRVDEALQWAETRQVSLGSDSYRVFTPAMTLMHLAAHMEHHAFAEPRIAEDLARAFATWHETWSNAAEPSQLESLARRLRMWELLVYCLRMCHRLALLEQCPAEARTRPWQTWVFEKAIPPSSLQHASGYSYRRVLPGLLLVPTGQALGFLWYRLFPPLGYLSAVTQRPMSARLYLHYVPRLLKALIRRRA